MESKNKDLNEIDDDDEIPELEEFEDLKAMRNKVQNESIPVHVVGNRQNEDQTVSKSQLSESNKPSRTDEDSFGLGFKKGFLKREANKPKDNTDKVVDLTHIKSKQVEKSEKFKLEEVQKNLSESENNSKQLLNNIMQSKDEWLNKELLEKLAKNPNLLQVFMSPEFTDILKLMQSNPSEAKRKYGNNPKFNEFFKEFSSLMANHFESMDKKSNPMHSDPEVARIMKDEKVMRFLQTLQKEGRVDFDEVQKDRELMNKINILMEKGVLKKEYVK